MSSPTSSYIFDDEGMTWITCDLCAGSFQREAGLCQACQGTKLRRVSHTYLSGASTPPQTQGGAAPPPPPPPPPKGDKPSHSHGTASGFGVYSRRS